MVAENSIRGYLEDALLFQEIKWETTQVQVEELLPINDYEFPQIQGNVDKNST